MIRTRTTLRRLRASVLGGLVAICLGACQTPSRHEVTADYEAGRYQEALAGAERLATHSSGAEHDAAEYLAGMSAYRLGKGSIAIGHLRQVTDVADDQVAGTANATLGLIYASRHQDGQALTHLKAAAKKLTGNNQAHAHYHVALVEQRLGRWPSAATHLSLAISRTTESDLRRAAQQRRAAKRWTVQLDAYGKKANAERRAGGLRPAAQRYALGPVRIVSGQPDKGGQLYLVQVGLFRNYAKAEAAAKKLRQSRYLIVPTNK